MPQLGLDLQALKQRIYRYSMQITSNSWEAEDLTQDVLLKLHILRQTNPSIELSNVYLYKIALNAWKDKLKKRKLSSEPLDDGHMNVPGIDTQLSTRELLEDLAYRLPARSTVILLLMDVFDFTAKEAAELLSLTEGSVQVALGRARQKLKKLARTDKENPVSKQDGDPPQLDFEALVEAFRLRDPKAICRSYIGLVKRQITVSKLKYINGKLTFYFEDPDGNRFMVTS